MDGAKQILAGKWKQLRGAIKKEWADIADADLDAVEGEWENMIGLLQTKYGFAKVEAERRLLDVASKFQQPELLETESETDRREPAVPQDQDGADALADKWKELRHEIKQQWSDIAESQLDAVDGQWDRMIGLLQETYGYAKLEAERRLLGVISSLQ